MKKPKPNSLLNRIQEQPTAAISGMLKHLPQELLIDPKTTVADLAMGGGFYLARILKLRLEAGINYEEAVKTLYGYESSLVYLNHARWNLGLQGANLAKLNVTDLENLSMQFDVTIGNPPFQETTSESRKDQASNLWSKFWVKALQLTKDDGIVSLISPTSWLSPSADLKGEYKYQGKNRLWDIFNSYSSVAQVSGVSDYFKGIGSSFGIVTVNKGGSEGLSFAEGYDPSLGFLPISGIEEALSKVGGDSTLGTHYTINQNHESGWRVSAPLTRKVTAQSVEILKDNEIPTSGSDKPGLYIYVHVGDKNKVEKIRNTIIDAADVLNTHCRWSGFMNIKTFKMLNYQP